MKEEICKFFIKQQHKYIYFARRDIDMLEDCEDIFGDSILVLLKKGYLDDKSLDLKSVERILFGIIKIKIKQYRWRKLDEACMSKVSTGSISSVGLHTPTYLLKQQHMKKYYQENKDKFRATAKGIKHKLAQKKNDATRYQIIRNNPILWAHYLERQRTNNQKRLARLTQQSEVR